MKPTGNRQLHDPISLSPIPENARKMLLLRTNLTNAATTQRNGWWKEAEWKNDQNVDSQRKS